MLLGLADAVDRVREVGCPVQRVLLIGGASASQAVQEIAADLLGVPVAIPAPGEYVAVGAARQAAWALVGGERPPAWHVAVDVTVEPADAGPGVEVRERYAAVVAADAPRRPLTPPRLLARCRNLPQHHFGSGANMKSGAKDPEPAARVRRASKRP